MKRVLDMGMKAVGWTLIVGFALVTCWIWIPLVVVAFCFFCVDRALGGGDW